MADQMPSRVFHYTSHRAFDGILRTRQIWARDSRLSNDRRELEYATELLVRAVGEVEAEPGFEDFIAPAFDLLRDPFDPFRLRSIDGYMVMASFSEEPNLLSQWRAYAPENGYSMGFHVNLFHQAALKSGFDFSRVEYDLEAASEFFRKEVIVFINSSRAQGFANAPIDKKIERFERFVLGLIPLVKHYSFAEEREWRAFRFIRDRKGINFHSGTRGLAPYSSIGIGNEKIIEALREVVIGPSDDQHTLATWTIDYLINMGYSIAMPSQNSGVVVSVSGSPYRLNR